MFDEGVWLSEGWNPSKQRGNSFCKGVKGGLLVVFLGGGWTAVYHGRFSPKYTEIQEAKMAGLDLVREEFPLWEPEPPKKRRVSEPPKQERKVSEPPKAPQETKVDIAYRILELQPPASEEQIQQAFCRLIKVHHPDLGGSDERARQLIEAREILKKGGSYGFDRNF